MKFARHLPLLTALLLAPLAVLHAADSSALWDHRAKLPKVAALPGVEGAESRIILRVGKRWLPVLHADMLHQFGIVHRKLTHRHLRRDFRLADVYGVVVRELLT